MKHILPVTIILVLLLSCASVFCAMEYVFVQANPAAGQTYTNPIWSPNGRSIAYVAVTTRPDSPETPAKNIYIATFSGGKWNHRLVAKDADQPIWSPDGKS